MLKNLNYLETLQQAEEDIKIIENQVLPMLKSKREFSLSEVNLISTVFFNVGSRMNTFNKIIETSASASQKVEAKKYFNQYSLLVEEMFDIIEE